MRLIWNKHGYVESGGLVAHDLVRLLVGLHVFRRCLFNRGTLIFKHLHRLYRQFNRLSSLQLLEHMSVTSANMIAGWNQRTNSPGPRLGYVMTGHKTSGKVAPSRTVYGDLLRLRPRLLYSSRKRLRG